MKKPIKKKPIKRSDINIADVIDKTVVFQPGYWREVASDTSDQVNIKSLSAQLDNAIENLENRLKSQIERIERIMK